MFGQTAIFTAALALAPAAIAQVSEGFESGWDQTAWPTYAPDCNQGGKVTLDTTTAHTGKNSIRVDGAGGYCGHIFVGTSKVPSGDVYVRTWLYVLNYWASDALLTSHPGKPPRPSQTLTSPSLPWTIRKLHFSLIHSQAQHFNFLNRAQAKGKHLRIGGQSKILMYNRESDDATLPDLSPQGIAASKALPTNTWTCFEYHLGTDGSIETWLNNATVPGLTSKPGVSNPNAAQWQRSTIKPKITNVNFGWESYGGDTNTFWYDDIVVSASRVGC